MFFVCFIYLVTRSSVTCNQLLPVSQDSFTVVRLRIQTGSHGGTLLKVHYRFRPPWAHLGLPKGPNFFVSIRRLKIFRESFKTTYIRHLLINSTLWQHICHYNINRKRIIEQLTNVKQEKPFSEVKEKAFLLLLLSLMEYLNELIHLII